MGPRIGEMLQANRTHAEEFQSQFDDVLHEQHPDVVTVCCSDSRVLQDHIWGNAEPGRIFTCGNIGNRVVQRTGSEVVVSGDVLYPIEHTGTETVVVVGHTGCGAITATYDGLTGGQTTDTTDGPTEPPGIEHCLDLLAPHLAAGLAELPDGLDRTAAIDRLVEYNVDRQVEALVTSDAVPRDVTVVGVVYDFRDVYSGRRGDVHVINVDGVTDVAELRERHPDVEPGSNAAGSTDDPVVAISLGERLIETRRSLRARG